METLKAKTHALLACLFILFANHVQAQDNLQEFIDNLASSYTTRAADTVTDIDLSAYSEPRTTTLYIRNGVNVRFINGTLTRATNLTDAPLVQIVSNSTLHVAESAKINGGNFHSNIAIVEIVDGELDVEGGTITGNIGETATSRSTLGFSVVLRDEKSIVRVDGGEIQHLSQSSPYYASTMIINGGTFNWIYITGHASMKGFIKSSIRLCNKEAYIELTDGLLENSSDLTLYNYEEGQVAVRNVKSKESANCFKLGYGGSEQLYLSYENNNLIVRNKSVDPIQTIENVEPGTLPDRIPENARAIIEELTITGKLNGTDIKLIREMANQKLWKLDILGSSIVSGGEMYNSAGGYINPELSTYTPFYTKNDSVTGVMFADLESLTYLVLPDGIKYIEGGSVIKGGHLGRWITVDINAFLNSKLETIIIGSALEYFSHPAVFHACSNLNKLIFRNNDYLRNEDGIIYNTNMAEIVATLLNQNKPKITFLGSVEKICSSAYSDFDKIENVEFTENIKFIGANAFSNCSKLNLIDLRNTKMRLLSSQVFMGCSDLHTAYLSTQIDSIDYRAFYQCSSLKNLFCLSSKPARLFSGMINLGGYITNGNPFSDVDVSKCIVHIPRGSLSAYKEAEGWKNFINFVEDQPGEVISSEDELQKRLDEIAAEKPNEAVTLTICEEGITMTKSISAQSGCKVIITGGKISTPSSMPHADGLIFILNEADITFRDITLELCTLRANYCYHFFNHGNLTFEKSKVIADKLTINGECRIDGYTQLPILYLSGQSRIFLLSAMKSTWIIDGGWSSFNVETPYTLISGYNYTITEEDYSKMQFANLPENLETDYDKEYHTVLLKKKTPRTVDDILQCLVDGRTDCYPGEKTEVREGETEIGCNDPLQCAIDATIDGAANPDFTDMITYVRPKIRFCTCDRSIIRIHRGSSLTLRNIDIEASYGENQLIYVSGTLIIDVNVYIYNFRRFIHILPGGHVIWRGGHTENVSEVIYNEGGTIEFEYGYIYSEEHCIINEKGGTLIISGGEYHGGVVNYGTFTFNGGIIDGGSNSGLVNYGSGTVTILGGTIKCDGGTIYDIVNYSGGQITIYNGTYIGEGGGGCIWSETDIWIEGGVYVTNIHIKRGACIRVIGRMTVVWRIHFFVFDEFDIFVPIVKGANGYLLTEEDYKYILIDLPIGYEWRYNHWEYTIFIWSKGDANGDCHLNAADIVEIVNYIMGRPSADFNISDADVNNDGVVNAADIVAIVNIIMEL